MLEKLTLIEAGQALGLSPDAVRMRIKRGTMRGEKDAEGRWLVWVNTEGAEAEHEPEREPNASGEREPEPGEQSAEALRARIGELERRLEELSEERDFLRTQLNNLTFAQGMAAQAQAQKALPNPARRSWWARLLGRG
jgi:DNA-binding transcriptional MerR regulator